MNKRMKQVPHSIYYEMKSEEKETYMEYIKRKIIREKNKNPLFFRMLELVKEHTKHYFSDFFVHDYNSLTIEQKGSKFIWNVYDCGSRLVRLENDFQEDMNASWEEFQALAKNYFVHDKLVFLVDVSEQTLTAIDPDLIDKTYFSNQFGKRNDYFEKKAKDSGNLDYFDRKIAFKDLMQEFRDYPPKVKIDEVFVHKKRPAAS